MRFPPAEILGKEIVITRYGGELYKIPYILSQSCGTLSHTTSLHHSSTRLNLSPVSMKLFYKSLSLAALVLPAIAEIYYPPILSPQDGDIIASGADFAIIW